MFFGCGTAASGQHETRDEEEDGGVWRGSYHIVDPLRAAFRAIPPKGFTP